VHAVGLRPIFRQLDSDPNRRAEFIGALNTLEKKIPPNAVVSAWYPLVSHVDNRSQIYVWPTPFYAEDWGRGTDTGARLRVASQVQYLLLPVPLTPGTDPNVFKRISSDFGS